MIATIAYTLVGIVLMLYSYFIYQLYRGWNTPSSLSPSTPCTSHASHPTCAIVIACHNEERHLPQLLSSIDSQVQSADEVIFIDDHSTDQTLHILQTWSAHKPHAHVLSATHRGKKAAISQGIHHAHSELIFCTDADCTLPPHWTENLVHTYVHTPFDMLILPVTMHECSHLVSSVTRLEFISLVSSGIALGSLGHPIMCNGANIAFRRSAWLSVEDQLKPDLLSGDDVFLLHAIKQRQGNIQVLKSPHVVVTTHPTPTIASFMNQRIRWSSKSTSYTDKESLFVASLIFSICFVQILLYSLSIFSVHYLICSFVLFVVKWLLDSFFLSQTRNTFVIPHLLIHSFLLSIFYPFYIVAAACLGCFNRSKW